MSLTDRIGFPSNALELSINNPQDSTTWDSMTAIKSRILRIWDVAPPGIRVCCIKFAQRIVLAQTSGIDGDVRVGYASKDGHL
jgi:hypothetical protein